MALRDILILPDKRLRQVSDPVTKIDAGIRTLVADMFDSMYDAPGIGLAAIQVGMPVRVVTLDLAKKDDPKDPQVLINPELLWVSRGEVDLRGRLPLDPGVLRRRRAPGQGQGEVSRSRRPAARDRRRADCWPTCLQHEIDHLNGILFIDHLSKLKRDRVIKKFTKAAAKREEA